MENPQFPITSSNPRTRLKSTQKSIQQQSPFRLKQANASLITDKKRLEKTIQQLQFKLSSCSIHQRSLFRTPLHTKTHSAPPFSFPMQQELLQVQKLFEANQQTIIRLQQKIQQTQDSSRKVEELISLLNSESLVQSKGTLNISDRLSSFDQSLLDWNSVVTDDFHASFTRRSSESEGIKQIYKQSVQQIYPYSTCALKSLHSIAFLTHILSFNLQLIGKQREKKAQVVGGFYKD